METKQRNRKMTLARETVRQLAGKELSKVGGGWLHTERCSLPGGWCPKLEVAR